MHARVLLPAASLLLLVRSAAAQEPQNVVVEPTPAPPVVVAVPAEDEPKPAEEPDRPRRRGFTLEAGLGASFMNVDGAKGVESDKIGVAPLSVGIGGFLTRDLALTFRMTGASLFQDAPGKTGFDQVVLGFYGASLQYYVTDRVFFGGGAGFGILAPNPFVNPNRTYVLGIPVQRIETHVGFAAQARVGWAFVAKKAYQFSVMSEVIPAFLDGGARAVGVNLALGFQYY